MQHGCAPNMEKMRCMNAIVKIVEETVVSALMGGIALYVMNNTNFGFWIKPQHLSAEMLSP